jgi:hypothetical protein
MPTKQSVCMKRSDIVLWGLGDNACATDCFVPGNGTRNDGFDKQAFDTTSSFSYRFPANRNMYS